jgi:N-acetylglutamate synthase-like GNAT family acetyltransferase
LRRIIETEASIIECRPAAPDDYSPIRKFLAENGWQQRVEDEERFRKMIENASRTVVAFDGDRLVGFARALCDDVSNGYIGTVAVADDKRLSGVGRLMVQRLIGDDPNITWVLRAGRGSESFWKKMGFAESSIAMERTRI